MGASRMLSAVDGPVVVCVGLSPDRLAAVVEAAGVPVVVLPDADALRARIGVPEPADRVVEAGKLRLDATLRAASWCGSPLALSAREFDLLFTLAGDPGRVWTFAELTARVWGRSYVGDSQAVVSAVKRLRRQLRGSAPGVRLESVRGVGYRVLVPSGSH